MLRTVSCPQTARIYHPSWLHRWVGLTALHTHTHVSQWSAGRLNPPLVTLRHATLTEMLQQLTNDLIRHFPGRPLVGMDSEGKRPIAKVQLAIYNSVYILDVSTASGEQELDTFLQAISRAKGIIALDRDLQEGAPPEEQDAFLLRNVRNHLEVVDLHDELTRNGWMPEDSYAYETVSGSRAHLQPQPPHFPAHMPREDTPQLTPDPKRCNMFSTVSSTIVSLAR